MQARAILAILLPVAAAFAQLPGHPIAYPADTLRLGSGNLVPFGFSSATTADEGRWQQLIPARYLPSTGGLLTGITAHSQVTTVAVTYASYRIQLSHTTATSLGSSFSGNLPAPQTVLNATNLTVNWVRNTWVPVNFTTPFVYNGTDNLVVSLTKVYDRVTNPVPGIVTHQTTGSPHRTDLVAVAYAASAFGAGGSTTDVVQFSNSSVLSMRLLAAVQGTTTLASVTQPNGTEYAIGTTAAMTVWAANGTAWGTLLNTQFLTPTPLPPFLGRLLVLPNFLIATGVTQGGSSVVNIPIPNDPSLVGSYWVLQSATAAAGLAFTNATDFFVRM